MFVYLDRNCIGMNFAMAEMKVAVAMILRRYVLFCLSSDQMFPDRSFETVGHVMFFFVVTGNA